MNKLMIFGVATIMLLISGCKTQMVTVDVLPSDAKVIANGVAYNNGSPMFVEANSGQQLAITAYKEGYREKIHVVNYSLSTLGKIEAWTCWLVLPAIGLFFDNAWELEENNIKLTLEPLTKEAKDELANEIYHANVDQSKDKNAQEAFNQM